MTNDTTHILTLLIIINVALCSYYYILHKDTVSKREEDKLILQLEEKFSDKNIDNNPNNNNKNSKEGFIPAICNGFHDKFFNNNKFLGWRLFYLQNQNKQIVEPDTNFKGIVTKNYLDNLPNVQNDVTPVKYQIR